MKRYLLLTAVVVLLKIVFVNAQGVMINAQPALSNDQVIPGHAQVVPGSTRTVFTDAQQFPVNIQSVLINAQMQAPRNNIVLQLSSGVFSDSYQLIFKTGGNMDMDDQDALKVSEGYVSISSLHAKGLKLAIEERDFPVGEEEVSLVVKGYASGEYHLKIVAAEFETVHTGVVLFDKFMNKKLTVSAESTMDYVFTIDSAVKESQGDKRFSLLLSKVSLPVPAIDTGPELLAYPNPFHHHLFINVKEFHTPSAEVRIKDLSGRLVWQKAFKDVQMNAQLELECQNLFPGLYLLEWNDHTNPKNSKTLKIIKQ